MEPEGSPRASCTERAAPRPRRSGAARVEPDGSPRASCTERAAPRPRRSGAARVEPDGPPRASCTERADGASCSATASIWGGASGA